MKRMIDEEMSKGQALTLVGMVCAGISMLVFKAFPAIAVLFVRLV